MNQNALKEHFQPSKRTFSRNHPYDINVLIKKIVYNNKKRKGKTSNKMNNNNEKIIDIYQRNREKNNGRGKIVCKFFIISTL